MFVAPYYQVYRVVKHAFRNRILGSVLDSGWKGDFSIASGDVTRERTCSGAQASC